MSNANQILHEQIYPNDSVIKKAFADLNPDDTDKKDYYRFDCPGCSEHEAFVYKYASTKNGRKPPRLKCSRANKCGESISMWDYVQDGRLSDQETLFKLAEYAGVSLPKSEANPKVIPFTPKPVDPVKPTERKILHHSKVNKGALFEDAGKQALAYLHNRGYSDLEIKSMGLALNIGFMADTHPVAIPYRGLNGESLDWITHRIDGKHDGGKYRYPKGVGKDVPILFAENKECECLILVEGIFNALHPSSKGMAGVIAVSGQPTDPLQNIFNHSSATSFVLVFDNDMAGRNSNRVALALIQGKGIPVSVVDLPEGINDPDQLIKEQGVGAFQKAIGEAVPASGWVDKHGMEKERVNPLAGHLKGKRDREKLREHGELLGYKLNSFPSLTKHIDGVQPGLYIIGAETNIGKTAFLTSVFLDLLDSNKEVRGIYFSLDDNKDIIINRLLGIHTELPLNSLQKRQNKPHNQDKSDNAYNKLIAMSESGKLQILDITEVNHIDTLNSIIRQNAEQGPLFVAIDGLYNLEVNKAGGIREDNIERANKLKALVDTYRIPVLTTSEVRKRPSGEGKKTRLTVDDLMETGKFGFNANLVWFLSPDNWEDFKEGAEPTLVLDYGKNKLGPFKGTQKLNFKKQCGKVSEDISSDDLFVDGESPY